MSFLRFKGKVSGSTRVKRTLDNYLIAFGSIFAKNRIEALLIKRTKARFLPKGAHGNAQKSPDGSFWTALSGETERYFNQERTQKLVDSMDLVNAIEIVRQRMRDSALQSPAGGGFSIGIAPGSPANEYARAHQFGGYFGWGNLVKLPARRFLGIGDADVIAVDNSMVSMLKKHGIGVN